MDQGTRQLKICRNTQANSRTKPKKNTHRSHQNKYPYRAHAAENSGLSQCSVTAIMQCSDSQLLSHMLRRPCRCGVKNGLSQIFLIRNLPSNPEHNLFATQSKLNLQYEGDACRVISCAVSYTYKVISLESFSESWICFTYKFQWPLILTCTFSKLDNEKRDYYEIRPDLLNLLLLEPGRSKFSRFRKKNSMS